MNEFVCPEIKNNEIIESCNTLYKKCDQQLLTKFNTPLEETYPEIFGEYDKGQVFLKNTNCKHILLIENATEIVSRIKDIPNFLETIFKLIIKWYAKDFYFAGSYTIEYDEYKKEFRDLSQLEKIKKLVKNKKKSIIQVALDLGDLGGHYGVIIFKDDKVIIFDSMQYHIDNVEKGFYTDSFTKLANLIFVSKDVITFNNPTMDECPQITGGFIKDITKTLERNKSFWESIQDTKSQNHFCYMWSIFYFHSLLEYDYNIFTYIKANIKDPLIVIKKYTWSIINSIYNTDRKLLGLVKKAIYLSTDKKLDRDDYMFLTNFFLIHFRSVWLLENRFDVDYIINLNLNEVRNFDIQKCIQYSIQ